MRELSFGVGVVLALVPRPGEAAGIESPELGAVSVGRGGAVVARPTDGLGLQFNPAGLGHARGVQLQADGKLVWHRVGFTPSHPDLVAAGEAKNQAGLWATPTDASVVWALGKVGPLHNLAVGLGAFGPSATGKLRFPADGAQRYDKIDVDYFLAWYTLGVGVRIVPSWSVGASLQVGQGSASFSQATRAMTGPLAAQSDVVAQLKVSSGPLVTGVVGLTWTPNPYWSVGASYRPRANFSADGTLTSQIPEALATNVGARQEGQDATLKLNFPHVVRAGVQWTPPGERLLVAFDAVYEAWRSLRQIDIETHDITISTVFGRAPLAPIVLRKDYHDAFSLRVGAEYQVLPDRLRLRAGYFFEAQAMPGRTTGVDFPNYTTHAPGVGATVEVFGVKVDVGYSFHFMPTRQVDDGVTVAQAVPPLPGAQPNFSGVNNGRYASGQHVLALGVRVPFSGLKTSP